MNERTSSVVAAVWLIATVVATVGLTDVFGTQTIFGMPWIVYLVILCQLSLFGLYIFISRTIWKVDEEVGR